MRPYKTDFDKKQKLDLPISNLSGLMSTPIIFVAPAALQPMITARPTAPRPQTAQFEPGST